LRLVHRGTPRSPDYLPATPADTQVGSWACSAWQSLY
jgi:hypothetical protein